MRACERKDQACATGMQALQPYSVGFAAADAQGHIRTPQLPAGRYWIVSDAKLDNKHMMWLQPIDLKASEAELTLDGRNVVSVN